MKNKLDTFLNIEFHKEYCDLLYNTMEFHLDFMGKNSHLLMDVRNFPNMKIEVLHPQKLSRYIPEKYFENYIENSLAFEKVSVYLFSDEECFIICQQNPEDRVMENIAHAQKETENYLKAYENGLVKEAYLLARDREIPVIFSIIDGEAKLISEDDIKRILEKYGEYLGDYEDWHIIAIDTNPSLVSFIYIDTTEKKFWYDVLSDEYEAQLFEKWGITNYYDD
jgi:hypothetical protein